MGRGSLVTIGVVAVLAVAVGSSLVASGVGCEQEQDADVATVTLGGRVFHLELAMDQNVRFQGLSGRTHIEPDGGMMFVFPRPQALSFVMRDCTIPIDIVFLDGSGRIVAMHAMVPEEPKRASETPTQYDLRLKRYPSRFDAQFAIELAGGTLEGLDLAEGQQVTIQDATGLKRRAR